MLTDREKTTDRHMDNRRMAFINTYTFEAYPWTSPVHMLNQPSQKQYTGHKRFHLPLPH